jgi:hypothetical protein
LRAVDPERPPAFVARDGRAVDEVDEVVRAAMERR